MTLPNPLAILNQAIKTVPAVKWALGVAGIISVIPIVKVGWKIDPMVAVLGTIVMLVLMTALVIFARLSTTAAIEFRYPILVFMWASLCLTIAAAALLFTSVFFHWPPTFALSAAGSTALKYSPTVGDEKVWDLEDQVNLLRGTWESVPEYGESKQNEVLERATKLGGELLAVSDDDLGPSGHVIKREFACYAFIIAAASENESVRKAQFAQQAIGLCNGASQDLQFLFNAKNQSKNVNYTADWARKKDQEPFVNYLTAMATCLVASSTGDVEKKAEAVDILRKRVPTFYLNKYPPDRDWTLKECVQSQGGLK